MLSCTQYLKASNFTNFFIGCCLMDGLLYGQSFNIFDWLLFDRWIGVWSEFIGDLIIFFTALFAVLGRESLNPGLIGLSLSFALQVCWLLLILVNVVDLDC